MRRQTFFSLAEANQAIAGVLERMNDHVMRRLGVSRRQLFETLERPALAALPETDYEFAEWRFARVSLDYHIELDGFFYSVPHKLIREQVDTRVTAAHRRDLPSRHARRRRMSAAMAAAGTAPIPTTCRVRTAATPNGRPSGSAAGAARSGPRPKGSSSPFSPTGRIRNRAFGPASACSVCSRISIQARAERVASRAVAIGALTYKSIASIIANKLDRAPAAAEPQAVIAHANLRGSDYFH